MTLIPCIYVGKAIALVLQLDYNVRTFANIHMSSILDITQLH